MAQCNQVVELTEHLGHLFIFSKNENKSRLLVREYASAKSFSPSMAACGVRTKGRWL